MATTPKRSISPPAFAARSRTRLSSSSPKARASRSRLRAGSSKPSPLRASADIVVLAIGEGANMSGEAQSRTEIVVPAPQQELAEAVAAVGKPDCRRAQARPRARARRRGRQRTGDPRHLVPRNRDRQCHRRRPVRRLQPLGPSARELPAQVRPGALLLRAQVDRPAQPAGAARAVQGALSAASPTARSTRSVTASPTARSTMAVLRSVPRHCR